MTSVSGSGARILAILDLFTEERPDWLPEEMMAALGYSRPTLYRYIKTLKDAGYLVPVPQGGFALGPRVTELDFLMRRGDPLLREGAEALDRIAGRFRGTALLVRWYGRKLLCVASVVSTDEPLTSYSRGRPMSLGRGAISRAIVAFLPARVQRDLIEEHLAEFVVAGVGSNRDEILGELRAVRRAGVATARGEVTPGVVGVAAPILAGERAPLGALALTSDARDVDPDTLRAIETTIRTEAAAISDRLAETGLARAAE